MADGVKIEQATLDRIQAMADKAGVNLTKLGVVSGHVEDALMYGIGAQMSQHVVQSEHRLHRPGKAVDVQHIWTDELSKISPQALEKARQAINGRTTLHRPTPPVKTLAEYSDAELIMEMIGRGFAAMKIPEPKDAS